MKKDLAPPLSHPVLSPASVEKAQDQEKQPAAPSQPPALPIGVAPQPAKNIPEAVAVETALPHWYSDLTMKDLLQRLLAGKAHVHPILQLEHGGFLEVLQTAIRETTPAIPSVLAIQIHDSHWVGIVIKKFDQPARLQVIYNDPKGVSLQQQWQVAEVVQQVSQLHNDAEILDLQLNQQKENDFDCGPFTVDTLVRLATANTRDIHESALMSILLFNPADGLATSLREQHKKLLAGSVASDAKEIDSTKGDKKDDRISISSAHSPAASASVGAAVAATSLALARLQRNADTDEKYLISGSIPADLGSFGEEEDGTNSAQSSLHTEPSTLQYNKSNLQILLKRLLGRSATVMMYDYPTETLTKRLSAITVDEALVVVIPYGLKQWAGMIIKKYADGKIQLIYSDPTGNALHRNEKAAALSKKIQTLVTNIVVLDLQCKQALPEHAGPILVNTIVTLVTKNVIENPGELHDFLSLQWQDASILEGLRRRDESIVNAVEVNGSILPLNSNELQQSEREIAAIREALMRSGHPTPAASPRVSRASSVDTKFSASTSAGRVVDDKKKAADMLTAAARATGNDRHVKFFTMAKQAIEEKNVQLLAVMLGPQLLFHQQNHDEKLREKQLLKIYFEHAQALYKKPYDLADYKKRAYETMHRDEFLLTEYSPVLQQTFQVVSEHLNERGFFQKKREAEKTLRDLTPQRDKLQSQLDASKDDKTPPSALQAVTKQLESYNQQIQAAQAELAKIAQVKVPSSVQLAQDDLKNFDAMRAAHTTAQYREMTGTGDYLAEMKEHLPLLNRDEQERRDYQGIECPSYDKVTLKSPQLKIVADYVERFNYADEVRRLRDQFEEILQQESNKLHQERSQVLVPKQAALRHMPIFLMNYDQFIHEQTAELAAEFMAAMEQFRNDGNLTDLHERLSLKKLKQFTKQVDALAEEIKDHETKHKKMVVDIERHYESNVRQLLAEQKSHVPDTPNTQDELWQISIRAKEIARENLQPSNRGLWAQRFPTMQDNDHCTLLHYAMVSYGQALALVARIQDPTTDNIAALENARTMVEMLMHAGCRPFPDRNFRPSQNKMLSAYQYANQRTAQRLYGAQASPDRLHRDLHLPDWYILKIDVQTMPTLDSLTYELKKDWLQYCVRNISIVSSRIWRWFYNVDIIENERRPFMTGLLDKFHQAQRELADMPMLEFMEASLSSFVTGTLGRSQLRSNFQKRLIEVQQGKLLIHPTTAATVQMVADQTMLLHLNQTVQKEKTRQWVLKFQAEAKQRQQAEAKAQAAEAENAKLRAMLQAFQTQAAPLAAPLLAAAIANTNDAKAASAPTAPVAQGLSAAAQADGGLSVFAQARAATPVGSAAPASAPLTGQPSGSVSTSRADDAKIVHSSSTPSPSSH